MRHRARHASAFLAALAVLTACGSPLPASGPGPRLPGVDPGPRRALRVVTWNVHDLFDAIDDSDTLDPVPSAAAVERKLERLAAVVRELDADALVLQEVEHASLLTRLRDVAGLGGSYEAYLVEGRDPRGIDVGVLTRLPIRLAVSHLDDRGGDDARLWARDMVELHLESGGEELIVLGAHLVSRRDPSADPRRAAQAAAVRDRALALLRERPQRALLVVGDLNDLSRSAMIGPLVGDPALVDLGARGPPDTSWTWSGLGSLERIDYALVDAQHSPLATALVWGGGAVEAASDHRPVVVDLW